MGKGGYEYRNGRWYKKKGMIHKFNEALKPQWQKDMEIGKSVVHVKVEEIGSGMIPNIVKIAEQHGYYLTYDTSAGLIFKYRVLVFRKI